MHECFLEIAFEAELNTAEDPELLAIAPEQCNEHPDTRAAAITDLRKMIIGEISQNIINYYHHRLQPVNIPQRKPIKGYFLIEDKDIELD